MNLFFCNRIKLLPFIFFSFSSFFYCGETDPQFYPEVTEISTPIEGILPHFKGENMDPYWSAENVYTPDLKKFSKISLFTHQGKKLTDQTILGKFTLVTFFYAKCKGVCPLITRNLLNLLPKIKNLSDVTILSITINPEIDEISELKNFRERYKISNPNWYHLTGTKSEIYQLARKEFNADVKVIQGQENLDDFVHTENIYLLDKKKYLRGIYRAKGTGDLERLVKELEILQEEGKRSLP